MKASVLLVIAVVQLAFLGGTLFLLIAHRWLLRRRFERTMVDEGQFVGVVRAWLAGELSADDFRADIDGRGPATVASVFQQYGAQIEGEQWEQLVSVIRPTKWSRRIRRNARSRLWWRRLGSARLLAGVATEDDLDLVRALVADENPAIQIAAISALTRVRTPDLLATILDKAVTAPRVVRGFVFDTLVSLRGPLGPMLIERLKGEYAAVQRQAWVTLAGELAVPELFQYVLPYAKDENLEVRVAAARTLGSFPHPAATKALLTLLGDAAWQVRTQAAAALGAIGAVEACPALHRALSDENWWVRLRAAIALRQLGQPGLEILAAVQAGDDRYAREMANYILGLSAAAVADYAA
jgi:ABC-type tungstate transport system substrate-binding protein